MEQFRTELNKQSKKICIIAQLSRNFIEFDKLTVPLFINWKEAFIENLYDQSIQMSEDILQCDSNQIINKFYIPKMPISRYGKFLKYYYFTGYNQKFPLKYPIFSN